MAPFFSVVIPTFNQAEYLRVALHSVLGQTYQDYEVIVVNNYSTDHTQDVIRDIADPRLRSINFRNYGVIGAGRNVGIKASRGAYVAFLDSDDTWYPEKLAQVAEAIKADSQLGLICHNQMLVRDGRVVRPSRYGPTAGFPGELYDYLLVVGNAVSTSASVVARQYLEKVGYFSEDPAFITVEDYDLWLKLSKVCPFHFIPEILGTHNYHATSASANVELHLRAALAVLAKHCSELRASNRPYPRRAIRRQYANAFYGAARQAQRNSGAGRTGPDSSAKTILGYYLRALRIYPFHERAYAGLALACADLILGSARRKRIAYRVWGDSWRWE